jgi:hypothetical protein
MALKFQLLVKAGFQAQTIPPTAVFPYVLEGEVGLENKKPPCGHGPATERGLPNFWRSRAFSDMCPAGFLVCAMARDVMSKSSMSGTEYLESGEQPNVEKACPGKAEERWIKINSVKL